MLKKATILLAILIPIGVPSTLAQAVAKDAETIPVLAFLTPKVRVPLMRAHTDVPAAPGQAQHHTLKPSHNILNWIKANVSAQTGMPFSFQVPAGLEDKVYAEMGEADSVPGILERVIVAEGLDIYDGAVAQILLTLSGKADDLQMATKPVEVYWDGRLHDLANIRAGYPVNNFIYDPQDPAAVSSDLDDRGKRGFIFRIVNANGKYNTQDPLDGKKLFEGFPSWPTVHWEDWKPVAGENAWVTMAALQVYHRKYFDPTTGFYRSGKDTIELQLAEELARAALLLQAENGGIRMAPLGTFREPADLAKSGVRQGSWWYRQISSENNISWYAALRMLYQVTGKTVYRDAMVRIEEYFKSVWNEQERCFYQGTHYSDGAWHPNNDDFALDVQTWAIAAFGPEKIDGWFGEGASYRIFQTAVNRSGFYAPSGELLGVGYTDENDRVSVEWTAGAIMAAQEIAHDYQDAHPALARNVLEQAHTMRAHMEQLRTDISPTQSAYAYSSKRGWIPFGWYSHAPEVLSLASTGWIAFVDEQFNPFHLPSAAPAAGEGIPSNVASRR